MSHDQSAFGAYVNQARQASGFSYQQLAVVTGIPRTTIVRLCFGRIAAPRPAQLVKLAQQLELPVGEVFARAGIDLPSTATPAPVNTSLKAHLRAEYNLSPWETDEAVQGIVRIIERHRLRQQRIQTTTNKLERRNPHEHSS